MTKRDDGSQPYYVQPLYTNIVGVTKKNPDGTDRQELLKKCKEGQELALVLDPDNPYDKNAIKICTLAGHQLGWIAKEDTTEIREWMSQFEFSEAEIHKLLGGTPDKPTLGCEIEIRLYRSLVDEKGVVEEKPAKKKSSTFRVQVSGGERLQKVYQHLSEGVPVELVRESEDEVSVYYEHKKFFGTKREYLGYLTKSADIARQMERGDKILNPQVAGFYKEEWGHQLILQITVEKKS
jgi:hypothetical protein